MAEQVNISGADKAAEDKRLRHPLSLVRGQNVRIWANGRIIFDGTVAQDRTNFEGELVIRGTLEKLVDQDP